MKSFVAAALAFALLALHSAYGAVVLTTNTTMHIHTGSNTVTFTPVFALAEVAVPVVNLGLDQTVSLEWNSSPDSNVTHYVYSGTVSRTYTNRWPPTTGTNIALSLSELAPGTNFLAVAAAWIFTETNAVFSDFSNEITITRLPPPVLKLRVTVDGSTNLTAWVSAVGETFGLASADRNFQFFRPGNTFIQVAGITGVDPEPVESEVLPPEPEPFPPLPLPVEP